MAVGGSILIIVWHVLSNEHARDNDLGSDYYDTKINPQRRVRNHVRELRALATPSPSALPPDKPSTTDLDGPNHRPSIQARVVILDFRISSGRGRCGLPGRAPSMPGAIESTDRRARRSRGFWRPRRPALAG